ncbi:hypothetical protein [Rhizobium phage RHEph18]|uniref:hypothetical protein n=1 Tax=Rhizobium TaxID=379 RepID=UPI0007EA0DA9|nr:MULTISPECIES: hypothetical protein [Rhizobium]ANL02656.1 hypothetical protein AMJ99_CH01069 [Rhizobium esperanzae]ANM33508.1 hypothetical protein AMK04_CH01070 [Rhizobium sp. N871]QIG73740.1 hypothetical protein EVC05_048 [Rhizobium phage RHph_N2]QXV74458.1 hypothetical protein [Rhizobium phage RHEph18]
MPFAKRYFVARLTETYATEYYDGCETARYDGFSPDREDAELFRSEAKAQRRADRVGGEVYATTVMVSLADGFKAPVIQVSARAA